MMAKRIAMAMGLVLLAFGASANDEIDAIFAEIGGADRPGCAVAVVKDGAVVYAKGFGLANLEYGIPNSPDTVFHVASVSKQFTAFAIANLVHEGKLSLDDDARKYVSEVPDFGDTITIRHLIHHTSGLRDQWELLRLAGWRMEDVITTEDILGLLARQTELNFRPGDRHVYSNMGYTLLAVIVERVSGQSFAEYCDAQIFKPLGMTSSHVHDDITRIVPNRAYSYLPSEDGFVHAPLQFATYGATSLFTTASDLSKWVINLGTRAYKPEVVVALFETTTLNTGEPLSYAFALERGEYRGLESWTHGGVDAGFRADVRWFPAEQFGTVVIGNVGDLQPGGRALKIADVILAERLAPDTGTPEKRAEEGTALSEAVTVFEGTYAHPRTAEMRKIRYSNDRLQFIGESGTTFLSLEGESRLVPADGSKAYAIEMRIGKKGVPEGFDLVRNGAETQSFVAVADRDDSETYLRELAGRYYGPELEVFYSVVLVGDRLHLERRKYGSVALGGRYRDGFGYVWDFGNVAMHFTRDSGGKVDGFRISTGRAWGVKFDRVD